MTSTSDRQTAMPSTRDLWVSLGMAVSATSAALSSFSGLRALAQAAGWAPLMAPLLPLTVDAYAMAATRVWLSAATNSRRARRFARSNAIGAILLSLAGNATWHLVAAQLVQLGWVVVLCTGAVPPVVLGLVAHLAVLRRQVDETAPGQPSGSVSRPEDGPRYRNEDELLAAARAVDAEHRATHGRPVSRDALRRSLRIGGQRATELVRVLRQADMGA